MVDQLLTLRVNELHNIDDGTDGRLQKGVSFNTEEDDDDYPPLNDSQHISESESGATKSSDEQKRGLFSIHSPSIDSVNDADALPPDAPLAEKIKKKKRRRQNQQTQGETKESSAQSPPWYLRVELLKPVGYVALVIILYLAWTYRAVWIPRLLTSNSRIRHIAIANEEKLQEKGYTPQASSSESTNTTNAGPDDDDDDDDDENTQTSPSKRAASQKLNLHARRNKMSFSRDRGERKRQPTSHSVVDDDDVDIDDVLDGSKVKPSTSALATIRRHRHRRSRNPTGKASSVNSVVDQLRKLISSRRKGQKVLDVLAEETGMKKQKVKQFIEKKNFRTVALDRLVDIVNSYDSTLLVLSK